MTAITTLLFPEPTLQRSPGAVIGWWERRRPLYNAAVGATGVVTISLLAIALGPAMFLQPGIWLAVPAFHPPTVCSLGSPPPRTLLISELIRLTTCRPGGTTIFTAAQIERT